MTEKLVFSVLEVGLTTGLFIVLVAALRRLFRRAPHRVFVLLWMVAGLRLLVPVNIESPVSVRGFAIRNVLGLLTDDGALADAMNPSMTQEPIDTVRPSAGDGEQESAMSPSTAQTELTAAENIAGEKMPGTVPGAGKPEQGATVLPETAPADNQTKAGFGWRIAAVIWLCGAGLLLAYGVVRYLWLCFRLRDAVRLDGNVWQSDRIDTPFLFGVIRPRIYVPFGIEEKLPYVLAHERTHLRHGDHIVKALWFAVLALYWFHPLVWLAYGLLGKDMELACDERVVAGLDMKEKGGYARALLELSMDRKPLSFSPLAFGEVGVKMRILHVLSYKKPAILGTLACLMIGAVFALVLLTDPRPMNAQPGFGNAVVQGEQPGSEDGKLQEQGDEAGNCYVRYEGKFRIDENGSYDGAKGPWSYDYELCVYYKDGVYKAVECLEPWDRTREKANNMYCGAVGSAQGQARFASRKRLLDSCGYYEELDWFENRDLRGMEMRTYREKQWYVDTEEVYADGGEQILRVEHWIDRETGTNVRSIATAPGVYVEKSYIVRKDIVTDQDMLIDRDRYTENDPGCYEERQEAVPAEELRTLLRSIRDDVQPGTLGSSLKAGSVAIRLLQWADTSSLSAGEVKVITEEFLAEEADQYEAFSEGAAADRFGMFMECIESVDDSCGVLQSDRAMGILDSIGMELSDKTWGDEPLPLVEAIMETVGLR